MRYDTTCLREIRNLLIENSRTLSVAESVTSGYLQAAFSSAKDATRFFQGGITAYNNGQKARHLLVEPIHAEACDCVSEKVSSEMATGSNRLFSSDYAIGITGYANGNAGQPGDTNDPTLFAFLAIAKNQEILLTRKLFSVKTSMIDVQLDYTNQALHHLARVLRDARDKSTQ
ncbi:MAG: nicotinamide-nucleotide amidohydrolase family protein [Solitalea sp.]